MRRTFAILIIGIIVSIFLLPFSSLFVESTNIMSWQYVIKQFRTYHAIIMTIIIALCSLLLNIIIGTPAAEVLARNNFKGKGVAVAVLMLPLIVPGFITSMGLQYIFIKLNLIENIWGVIIIHSLYTLPYYIRVVTAGFQTVSVEYEYMGWVFGANGYKNFFYVTFPQIIPSILVGSGLVLTVSFAQYLNTLIIGGGKVSTISILMFPYMSSGNITIGSVFALLFVTVNLILVLITEVIVQLFFKKCAKG